MNNNIEPQNSVESLNVSQINTPSSNLKVNKRLDTEAKKAAKKTKDDVSGFLKIFKDVFVYAYGGFRICFINPFMGGYNATAKSIDDIYKGTIKKQEKEVKESKFDIWYKNSSIYKQKEAALQKEKKELLTLLGTEEGTRRNDKPTVYRYKVRDEKGKISEGTFTGVSYADCNAFLLNEQYEVFSIKANKYVDFLYGSTSFLSFKMSTKDLIFWLTQLSTYIKSGIPLTDSMRILSKQMGKDVSKKRLFDSIVYELTMGESFSQALAKQGNVFPPLLINMLKAAEATGELEETLDDMTSYYDEIDKNRKQMISAMTYPVLVSVFAIGVITFILLYVVPQFTDIYTSAGIEISGMTLFVINVANFLKANIFNLVFIVLLIVAVIWFLYNNLRAFKREMQVVLMKIPVVKNVIIYNEITIFTKTFASLLKNNVYITESIDILSKITENIIYKEIMFETINNIARGEKISESFKDHWAIPDVAYYMIVTGESTGELAEMMDRVSKYYQEMHRNIITSMKSFIEPIMIAGLAVVVGGVILAVIIPMFNMYSQISM